jgi:hypothetical protein
VAVVEIGNVESRNSSVFKHGTIPAINIVRLNKRDCLSMLKKVFVGTLLLFSVYSIYLNAGSIYRGDTGRILIILIHLAILAGYFKKIIWIRKIFIAYAALLILGGGGMWLAMLFGGALPDTIEVIKRTLVFLLGSFFLFCTIFHKEWFAPNEQSA